MERIGHPAERRAPTGAGGRDRLLFQGRRIVVGDLDSPDYESLTERCLHIRAETSKSTHARDVTIPIEVVKQLDRYIADYRADGGDDDFLFVDRRGGPLTGNAVQSLFKRLRVRAGIRDLCAHMLRHTWATQFNRSASGSRFDLQVEGGWTTGRMVDRYCKARPFEERRRADSPFKAFNEAVA